MIIFQIENNNDWLELLIKKIKKKILFLFYSFMIKEEISLEN